MNDCISTLYVVDESSVDFMSLRLNSSSLTCSICALAAIILQLVAMECQKLHMVDSPIVLENTGLLFYPLFSQETNVSVSYKVVTYMRDSTNTDSMRLVGYLK